jgi:hypothetical protein
VVQRVVAAVGPHGCRLFASEIFVNEILGSICS